MHWVAPTEKDTTAATVEEHLWDAADQFHAKSGLKSQEYSPPVLGLIFLRFAEVRFATKCSQCQSSSPLGGEWAGVRGEKIKALKKADGKADAIEAQSAIVTKSLATSRTLLQS